MMHHRNCLNSNQKKILQGQFDAPPIEPIRRNCQDLSSIIEGLNDEQTDEQTLDFVEIVNPV